MIKLPTVGLTNTGVFSGTTQTAISTATSLARAGETNASTNLVYEEATASSTICSTPRRMHTGVFSHKARRSNRENGREATAGLIEPFLQSNKKNSDGVETPSFECSSGFQRRAVDIGFLPYRDPDTFLKQTQLYRGYSIESLTYKQDNELQSIIQKLRNIRDGHQKSSDPKFVAALKEMSEPELLTEAIRHFRNYIGLPIEEYHNFNPKVAFGIIELIRSSNISGILLTDAAMPPPSEVFSQKTNRHLLAMSMMIDLIRTTPPEGFASLVYATTWTCIVETELMLIYRTKLATLQTMLFKEYESLYNLKRGVIGVQALSRDRASMAVRKIVSAATKFTASDQSDILNFWCEVLRVSPEIASYYKQKGPKGSDIFERILSCPVFAKAIGDAAAQRPVLEDSKERIAAIFGMRAYDIARLDDLSQEARDALFLRIKKAAHVGIVFNIDDETMLLPFLFFTGASNIFKTVSENDYNFFMEPGRRPRFAFGLNFNWYRMAGELCKYLADISREAKKHKTVFRLPVFDFVLNENETQAIASSNLDELFFAAEQSLRNYVGKLGGVFGRKAQISEAAMTAVAKMARRVYEYESRFLPKNLYRELRQELATMTDTRHTYQKQVTADFEKIAGIKPEVLIIENSLAREKLRAIIDANRTNIEALYPALGTHPALQSAKRILARAPTLKNISFIEEATDFAGAFLVWHDCCEKTIELLKLAQAEVKLAADVFENGFDASDKKQAVIREQYLANIKYMSDLMPNASFHIDDLKAAAIDNIGLLRKLLQIKLDAAQVLESTGENKTGQLENSSADEQLRSLSFAGLSANITDEDAAVNIMELSEKTAGLTAQIPRELIPSFLVEPFKIASETAGRGDDYYSSLNRSDLLTLLVQLIDVKDISERLSEAARTLERDAKGEQRSKLIALVSQSPDSEALRDNIYKLMFDVALPAESWMLGRHGAIASNVSRFLHNRFGVTTPLSDDNSGVDRVKRSHVNSLLGSLKKTVNAKQKLHSLKTEVARLCDSGQYGGEQFICDLAVLLVKFAGAGGRLEDLE